MPLEQSMRVEALDDPDAVDQALSQNWEPFAVYKGDVYFRRQFHNEDREPLSSTKHPNAAGNEEDRG